MRCRACPFCSDRHWCFTEIHGKVAVRCKGCGAYGPGVKVPDAWSIKQWRRYKKSIEDKAVKLWDGGGKQWNQ